MHRRPAWVSICATLAFLFASLANAHAHVHVCMDGQEPPSAVHLTHGDDAGEHLAAHLGLHPEDDHGDHTDGRAAHDDIDVDFGSLIVLKTLQYDLTACATATAGVFAAAPDTGSAEVPTATSEPRGPPPRYWRPPLRAPPR